MTSLALSRLQLNINRPRFGQIDHQGRAQSTQRTGCPLVRIIVSVKYASTSIVMTLCLLLNLAPSIACRSRVVPAAHEPIVGLHSPVLQVHVLLRGRHHQYTTMKMTTHPEVHRKEHRKRHIGSTSQNILRLPHLQIEGVHGGKAVAP